jgi:hypothetical protein
MLFNLLFEVDIEFTSLSFVSNEFHTSTPLIYLRECVLHNLFFYNICEVLMHFSCYVHKFGCLLQNIF